MEKAKLKFVSPIRYPGGKTRLAKFFAKTIEKNFTEEDKGKVILVEPYAGGAGAALSLLFAGQVNRIIINDFDSAIYAFWKTALSDSEYLIKRVLEVKITIEEWKRQKEIYNRALSSDHELAFATLFLNRTNRSGIIEGGPIGGMDQSGDWKLDVRFTKSTLVKRLKRIKRYKNKIKVYNLDGISLLKKIERCKNMSNYFIFLDPPYYQKGKLLYLNHYEDSDHEKLRKFLQDSSLKWIMTYDDVSYIRKLYTKMRKRKFTIQHSAYQSKIGKEIMIFSKKLNLHSHNIISSQLKKPFTIKRSANV
ncbi:MAG: DNA adenine methylase [Candidatus Susulua stagnicola]|nr:DNA adenine methylase [Candidatus Susulua stagnicola]